MENLTRTYIIMRYYTLIFMITGVLLVQCRSTSQTSGPGQVLSADVYFDKVRGAWQAILVANYTGLAHEGIYLDEPGPGNSIELVLLDEWPTDDDTSVEWVDLHILETHGLDPTYEQIRDEWVDHLNHDIWVSTRKARDLMDEGILPPETGSPELNPDGVWSIDAQLQNELFGLIAPGMPDVAAQRARYFARVTNSGLAVEVSAFYATLYALAFFESDVPTLIEMAQQDFPSDGEVNEVINNVRQWYDAHPTNWRETRSLIRDTYDNDPEWWGSKVNFGCTIMALFYGQGDMMQTMTIAGLAGWDADNNMTTSVGLLALIGGYEQLPEPIRSASDLYYNEDVTGDLPKYQTVSEIAARTQALAEQVIVAEGGSVADGRYFVAVEQ
ncbi:ADP-ribosylglycohydrolase family protein [Chloroflexi bacterium TSY]|nr:ADP-ribosylglycohydrolase family protein [Chloroflexi bacterium TSY]